MSAMMCLAYLIAWTPYAVLSIINMAGVSQVPVFLAVASPLFAKSLSSWNALIFFSVRSCRQDLMLILKAARDRWPRITQTSEIRANDELIDFEVEAQPGTAKDNDVPC